MYFHMSCPPAQPDDEICGAENSGEKAYGVLSCELEPDVILELLPDEEV